MPKRPIVLIHGYSATSDAFAEWRRILVDWGYGPLDIHIANYVSLSDEVTIPDLAKGFEAALRSQPGLDDGESFDAIVHSTGMLVVRTWAFLYPEGRSRLKHLVGLAPASFGSPLAHKGRSYLGRVVSGNPEKGPDFREAGDNILDALELGSTYTWDLAMADLIGEERVYGSTSTSPYVSVFCGTSGYKGVMSVVNQPGTDGTVRLAGAALNSRLITLDMRGTTELSMADRYRVAPWSNSAIPVVPIAGLDHGSIMSKPSKELREQVKSALAVDSEASNEVWLKSARTVIKNAASTLTQAWQQFVFRVIDGEGRPVTDYFIDLHVRQGSEWVALSELEDGRPNVHPYSGDLSYRCFHVDVARIKELGADWAISVRASTGSTYVAYSGWVEDGLKTMAKGAGAITAVKLRSRRGVEFFHPWTTTLVEVVIDRVPVTDVASVALVEFTDRDQRVAAREAARLEAEEAAETREAAEREARLVELTEDFSRRT